MYKQKIKVHVPKNIDEFERFIKSYKKIIYKEKFKNEIEPGYIYLVVFTGDIGVNYFFKENGFFEYFTFSYTKFYRKDFFIEV